MSKLSTGLVKLKDDLKQHWNTPAEGKYVPYKEHFSIFGAISFNYATRIPIEKISFAASCYLIMYHYNLPYLTFSIISLIGAPLGYFWNFLAWMVADNLGYLPKKKERIYIGIYLAATVLGVLLMAFDWSFIFSEGSSLSAFINSLAGINTKTIFNIVGVQLFGSGYGGLRTLLWRKKLLPKYGRYKYKIYSEFWQKAIMFILIGWLPIYNLPDQCERVWLIYLLISVFNFYDAGNHSETVANFCTPNADERFVINTWAVKMGHCFDSILGFLVPIFIGLFALKNKDINIYRYLFPAVYIFCAIMTTALSPKIHERIPQPPIEKKVQIGFWDGIFGVMRNKYSWINTISDMLNSLGDGQLSFMTILLLYTLRADSGIIYSVVSILITFSGTPGAFLAPFFAKKFTYKQMKIFDQALQGVAMLSYIAIIYFGGTNYVLVSALIIVVRFIQQALSSPVTCTKNEMNRRLKDYQMYLSGERLESFQGIFNIIIAPVTTLVGLIIPLLLLRYGYNSNWDVLFLDSARKNILIVPFAFDAAGFFLMIIPYLFWDYDDKKHQKVVAELKRRAVLMGGQDFDKQAADLRKQADVNSESA